MTVSTYTNELMRALPAALRPNPWNIDEHVMRAVEKGWSVDDLAIAAYAKEHNPTPAFVVTNIRHLADNPPHQTVRADNSWKYGHLTCTEHQGCELCRCVTGTVTHHKPSPMPDHIRTQLASLVKGFGIPSD